MEDQKRLEATEKDQELNEATDESESNALAEEDLEKVVGGTQPELVNGAVID